MKGEKGNKQRAKRFQNPWVSGRVNLDKVGLGGAGTEAQEALEQIATQAMEEAEVLDKLMETMASIGEEERT